MRHWGHKNRFVCAFLALLGWTQSTHAAATHVIPISFHQQGLVAIEWTSAIVEYDGASGNDFRIRLDFHFVEMQGALGAPAFTTAIQNVYHVFGDDSVGIPQVFPGMGLYWSSLLPGLPDGVQLNANPVQSPNFGRIFENVDGIGDIGNNIYSRQSLELPSIGNPTVVHWSVQRVGIVSNPSGQLTRGLDGTWIPLTGTFAAWQCLATIDGVQWNIATYYLPVEYCEFIDEWTPMTLSQEFGDGNLALRRTKVRYSDLRVSDGVTWFPLTEWMLTETTFEPSNDERFGWYTDGQALFSVCGDNAYATTATRTPGAMMFLDASASCGSNSIPSACDTDCNSNGMCDFDDVELGMSADCNANHVPDECEGGVIPRLALSDGFCPIHGINNLNYESYSDNRLGGNSVVTALAFGGTLSLANGSTTFVGPTFRSPAHFFPVVQNETNRGFVWLHPGNVSADGPTSIASTVKYTAEQSGDHRVVGAFARANDFMLAGDGVVVSIFRGTSAAQPIFSAAISSAHEANGDDPFLGMGVASFDLTISLVAGEDLRFAVFPGAPGDVDIAFDATALRFHIWTPTAHCLGDVNCDDSVDPDDVWPFVIALLDPPMYVAQFPTCQIAYANLNGDLAIDGRDISGFVSAILDQP